MRIPLFAPRRAGPAADPPPGSALEPATRPAGPSDGPAPAGPAESGARTSAHGYAREAAALLLLAGALYAALALASFRGDPMRPEVAGADWVGPVGAELAHALASAVGFAAWFVPIELAMLAMPLLDGRPSRLDAARVAGDVIVVVVLASLAHVAVPDATAFGAMPIGGSVGLLFGEVARALFSTIGSYIIGCTAIALILVGRATFSFIESVRRVRAAAIGARDAIARAFRALARAWSAARELDREVDGAASESGEPSVLRDSDPDAIIAALADRESDPGAAARLPAADPGLAATDDSAQEPAIAAHAIAALDEPDRALDSPPERAARGSRTRRAEGARARAEAAEGSAQTARQEAAAALDEVPTPSPILPTSAAQRSASSDDDGTAERAGDGAESASKPARKARERAPRIVDTSAALEVEKADEPAPAASTGRGFDLPSIDLLDPSPPTRIQIDEERLKATAQLLLKTLGDYGVSGDVGEIYWGPTVTTFEVSPAAGTKVSKVAGLADDLALGLSRKVRIIAPIPGKNRIGFEIPNEQRVPVNLRELIEDRRFLEMKAPLPCVLGRDIIGAPYFADLASMPHVIVAGATGAGKSVGLNVMLMSLLFRRTPEELRLLMIDPKVVELAPFDRIPHMLLPVVTDMKQAANALKWAVDEMERRYQLFANAGTRNIGTYNAWVERVLRGEAKPPKGPVKVDAVAPDGTHVEIDAAKDGSDAALPEKIPYIVIVVDEFADLMMQQGKDVEAAVARLAQKARAAGMHVILATQRPSVDVITGMIKANFPTRIAFRVAQKVDSRTILDEQGAEHLLGRGDMLVKMNGSSETKRVQCPFCSEEEVQRVTDFLRKQGEPVYDEAILRPRDEDGAPVEANDAEEDPMYDAAVRIVAETRRCSTSWLQRKLGVGYNRAAKIVEAMERRGLVGPANGAKDREVLIGPL